MITLLICGMGCGVLARGEKGPMYVDGETAEKPVGSRSQMQKESAAIFFPLANRVGPLGTSGKDCAWAAENLVTRVPVDQLCAKTE